MIIIKNGKIVANDTMQELIKKYSNDQYIDFCIESDNLIEVETEIAKVTGAWKIEFVKKESKNIFRFKALMAKDSNFEENLKSFLNSKNWKLTFMERNNANLEEIFLKLASEEEDHV